jgi:hypothetical protein
MDTEGDGGMNNLPSRVFGVAVISLALMLILASVAYGVWFVYRLMHL